jgi:hypothetical protein
MNAGNARRARYYSIRFDDARNGRVSLYYGTCSVAEYYRRVTGFSSGVVWC